LPSVIAAFRQIDADAAFRCHADDAAFQISPIIFLRRRFDAWLIFRFSFLRYFFDRCRHAAMLSHFFEAADVSHAAADTPSPLRHRLSITFRFFDTPAFHRCRHFLIIFFFIIYY
jgi:hypothetical protein